MQKFFPLCILLGITFGCASSEKNTEKAALHLQIGTSFLTNGKYPEALQELLTAESLNPDDPIIQNNLAIAYYVRQKYVDAESHFKKAVSIDSKYTDARNNLGRVYIDQGKIDDAINELKKVTKDLTYSTPEKGYVNLGLAYLKSKNYTIAKSQFLEAMKINRNYCPAHSYYGQTLYFMKEFEKAAKALDSTLQICKDIEEAHYYNALTYYELGQRGKALARMREIVTLYPRSTYADKARNFINTSDN